MPIMSWTSDMSVGVTKFDAQHQRLIDLINELHDAMAARKGKEALGSVLDALLEYTKTHFAEEEQQLQAVAYPGYLKQRGEHKTFTVRVQELKEQYATGKPVLTMEVMSFLRDWLKGHIMGSDKMYTKFVNDKGIR